MDWLKENWFKVGILLVLGIGIVLFLQQHGGSSQRENTEVSSSDLQLEWRRDCKEEYDDAVQTVETWAQSDIEGAQLFGRSAGILDTDNFVREKEEWLKECIEEKASVWAK